MVTNRTSKWKAVPCAVPVIYLEELSAPSASLWLMPSWVVKYAWGKRFQEEPDGLGWLVVLIQLKKAKCKILHLGWGNPQCLYRLVDAQIESSQTEKYSGTSVNEKLYMSQQWALGNLERQSFPGLHQKKLDGQDEGCFVLVRCYTEYGIHLWCPQYPWECTKGGLRKWSEGWNMSLTKLGWESWGCSAWRRLWMLSKNKGGLAR